MNLKKKNDDNYQNTLSQTHNLKKNNINQHKSQNGFNIKTITQQPTSKFWLSNKSSMNNSAMKNSNNIDNKMTLNDNNSRTIVSNNATKTGFYRYKKH